MPFVILDKINYPKDLKKLTNEELKILSSEIREFIISNVSKTGGHLGANLGVVELTIALHKVFNTPKDKLVWDIGHQSYVHKILTGRKELFSTLREKDGLSGFANILESEYDHFGAGHSSTSISAALGMAIAKKQLHKQEDILAIIGDASIVSGMAFEALNHAGSLDVPNFTVILNDNNKSILNSVGAIKSYFSKLTSSYSYSYIRKHSKAIIDSIPFGMGKFIKDIEKYIRNLSNNGFFEALGFFYIGPIDGHNMDHLISVLSNIKNNKHNSKPILLHVITKKGNGYLPAENAIDNYHGVGKFCIESGKMLTSSTPKDTFSKVFANTLEKEAEKDSKIIAINPGTVSGVGLVDFCKKFPNRTFDVGIAEQHAVTFAAGLAIENFKPYVCFYSTFSQRAYDQIVHDVSLQSLPVRFVLDRFGFVGEDGATHHGLLNYSMYLPLPNIVYMAPFTEEELKAMIKFMTLINNVPSFVSFSKGDVIKKSEINKLIESKLNVNKPKQVNSNTDDCVDSNKDDNYLNACINGVKFGTSEILKKGSKIAVISMGLILKEVIIASNKLLNEEIDITIVNARFLKPLDSNLFQDIISNYKAVLTIEEGYGGAFFSLFYKFYLNNRHLNKTLQLSGLWVEEKYFEQSSQLEQIMQTKLDANSIYNKIKDICLLLN